MNRLIHQIYATALDAKQWPELIKILSSHIHGPTSDEPQQMEDASKIKSHLDQAIEIRTKNNSLEDKSDLVESSLSLLPVALFTFIEKNNQNTVEAINHKAEILLPELSKKLQEFYSHRHENNSTETDNLFSEHVLYDDRSYFFLLLPIKAIDSAKNKPVVLVSLSNQYLFNDSQLFEHWNFSKKETAICKLLLEGESIQSISLKNSRSIHTIRSQVKSIFQKSGCNSQINLIRQFYNSPLPMSRLEKHEEDYLFSSLVSYKFKLSDGRVMSWSEQGDKNGIPVLLCHGMHQSRLTRHPDELFAITNKIRIITPDRPGYGASNKNDQHKIKDWSKDVEQLLQHLAIDKFTILGLGLGTSFALACAEHFNERIIRTVCVGLSHFIKPTISCKFPSKVSQAACILAKKSPGLSLKVFKLMGRDLFLKDPSAILNNFYPNTTENDRNALLGKKFQQLLLIDFAESNRQGFGEATINELNYFLNQPRMINPSEIKTPVICWYEKNCQNPDQDQIEYFVDELANGSSHCIDSGDTFIIYHEWKNYLYNVAYGEDIQH